MQEIILYATANEVLARVRDRANAKAATPPTLARGCGFRLKIRLFANAYDDTPYPIANLANITSWAFVMDSDWDSATPFKIVADAGEIAVGEVQDQYEGEVVTYTEAVVPVSETNTEELAAWLGSDEGKDGLNAELIGYDGTGEEAFVLQIKGFSVRNRLGSVGDPTPIPSAYLTADQVRALIASGAVLQFSPDGATWKDSQEEGDIYLRFRSASDASAAWSQAIALPRGANGADGESAFLYVRYASDAEGTGFSATPSPSLPFIGILATDTALDPVEAPAFSGLWVRYLGEGTPGKDGASAYIYVAYASDNMGSNFSLSPTSGLKYRAELHTNIPLESPNAADFSGVTWVKYLGDDGAGAGDMLKAVYDLDDDGVVDSAAKLATARKIGSANFDGSGNISLSDMGAQPALPTNGEDGQFLQKTATGVTWATPPSTSQAEWGGIGGTLSDQSDLKSALDAKADSSALTLYAPKADSLAGYGITDAYTKGEVDAKVSAVYRYKGSVAIYAELPTEGNTVGDVWNVAAADEEHGIKAGDNVAWTGSAWDALSGEVDLTPFALKAEAGTDHNHDGRYIPASGSITVQPKDFAIKFPYTQATAGTRTGYLIGLDSHNRINIGGSGNTDQVILNANELIFKLVYGKDRYASFHDAEGGSPERARLNFATGTFNVQTAFSEGGTLLSDKYAAKSHTHAMGDITGLPASGGTAGQVLTKTDTGAEWADAPSGGTSGEGGTDAGAVRYVKSYDDYLKVCDLAREQDIHHSALFLAASDISGDFLEIRKSMNGEVVDDTLRKGHAYLRVDLSGGSSLETRTVSTSTYVVEKVRFVPRNGGTAQTINLLSGREDAHYLFPDSFEKASASQYGFTFKGREPAADAALNGGWPTAEVDISQRIAAYKDKLEGEGTYIGKTPWYLADTNVGITNIGDVFKKYEGAWHMGSVDCDPSLTFSESFEENTKYDMVFLYKDSTGSYVETPTPHATETTTENNGLYGTGGVATIDITPDPHRLDIQALEGTALAVSPGKAYSWTLSGNGTLSLGDGWEAGSLSDSVVLLSPGSYSVSCSGNVTMVDALQAGKMNLCVVRWLGDRARLYVVDSESPGTITAQPVTASGTVGTSMSVNLADYVTVSTGANSSYAMASGSTLPSGLSLSSEGVLSGTPESESSDSLTVDVTAAGCTPTTLALTMNITAASTSP